MTIAIKRLLVQYEGKTRSIPKEMWENNKLEAKIVGEARVVVRRGSLIANIPDDVPFGTFCICVNLASIKLPAPRRVREDGVAEESEGPRLPKL